MPAQELAERVSSRFDRTQERLPPVVGNLLEEVREREVLLYAGGLAFYGLISLAPFLVITFWIAGGIVGEDTLRDLGRNLDDIVPSGVSVSPAIDSLAEVGTGVGLGALLVGLWPATAYGSGLVKAFNRIAHQHDEPLKGVRGRLKALILVVVLPLFVLSGLFGSYLVAGLFDGGWVQILGWALALLAGFAVGVVQLAIIYVVFGPGQLPRVAVLQGAAAASAAIAVMSLGYAVYLGQGADFEERVAGSGLAAVVLLALWLYLANAILLAGYSLARSCAETRSGECPG